LAIDSPGSGAARNRQTDAASNHSMNLCCLSENSLIERSGWIDRHWEEVRPRLCRQGRVDLKGGRNKADNRDLTGRKKDVPRDVLDQEGLPGQNGHILIKNRLTSGDVDSELVMDRGAHGCSPHQDNASVPLELL